MKRKTVLHDHGTPVSQKWMNLAGNFQLYNRERKGGDATFSLESFQAENANVSDCNALHCIPLFNNVQLGGRGGGARPGSREGLTIWATSQYQTIP